MSKISFGLGASSKNNASSEYGVTVTFFNGTIDSNIMEEKFVSPSDCTVTGLDFSCKDNSQYIGAI